jgi:hypothetical protein
VVGLSALPTFLVIGRAKCGTSALHEYLAGHPEIQMSRPKELRFFLADPDPGLIPREPRRRRMLDSPGNWGRGVEWYGSHFDPRFGIRGESTPGYTALRFPGTAERIASVIPDVRLVLCVRDPVERALSSYRSARVFGNEPRPVAEALTPGSSYASGYAASVAPYLDRFPRERLLIVQAERLDAARRDTLAEVFAFLGAEPGFWSDEYDRRWNVTAAQQHGAWRVLTTLRRSRWGRIADRLPTGALRPLQRAQARTAAAPRSGAGPDPGAGAVPRDFVEELRADAERFRAMVGLELPGWSV